MCRAHHCALVHVLPHQGWNMFRLMLCPDGQRLLRRCAESCIYRRFFVCPMRTLHGCPIQSLLSFSNNVSLRFQQTLFKRNNFGLPNIIVQSGFRMLLKIFIFISVSPPTLFFPVIVVLLLWRSYRVSSLVGRTCKQTFRPFSMYVSTVFQQLEEGKLPSVRPGLSWYKRVPNGLVSDRFTYLKNGVVCLGTKGIRVPHHFPLPYCVRSDGAVERLDKDLICICCAILSVL